MQMLSSEFVTFCSRDSLNFLKLLFANFQHLTNLSAKMSVFSNIMIFFQRKGPLLIISCHWSSFQNFQFTRWKTFKENQWKIKIAGKKRLLVATLVILYFNFERYLGPYNSNLVGVHQGIVLCPMLFIMIVNLS